MQELLFVNIAAKGYDRKQLLVGEDLTGINILQLDSDWLAMTSG